MEDAYQYSYCFNLKEDYQLSTILKKQTIENKINLSFSKEETREHKILSLIHEIAELDQDKQKNNPPMDDKIHLLKSILSDDFETSSFKKAFEKSAIGIMLIAFDSGRILRANEKMTELLGYSPAEFKLINIYDTIPQQLHSETQVLFDLLTAQGQLNFETTRISKTGKTVDVEITLSSILCEQYGRVILCNMTNISKRKEQQLAQQIAYRIARHSNTGCKNLKELGRYIQNEISQLMCTENFFIALKSGRDSVRFEYIADAGNKESSTFSKKHEKGLTEHLLKHNKVLRLTGKYTSAFVKENGIEHYGFPPKSWLGAPILADGEAIGVIACQSYTDSFAYNEAHEQILSWLGSEIGNFIQRIKSTQERDRILNLSQDLICVAKMNGKLNYINPSFSRILGFSDSYFYQHSLFDLIHPDDYEATKKQISASIQNHESVNISNRIKNKQGDYQDVSWSITPIAEEDAFYCMGTDVTLKNKTINELINSEDKYRGLFTKMREGLLLILLGGTIKTANPSICKMLGYTKKELEGKASYELFLKKEDAHLILSNFEGNKEDLPDHYETQLYTKTGDPIWVQISSSPYYSSKGEFFGSTSIISDISSRKETETQKAIAYALLKKSEVILRREQNELLRHQYMLLSTQLNPHFIFNALNSIQFHIMERDPEPALQFLSHFATLMRSVLKNSTIKYISLEDEIAFLNTYLLLEKNRHREKFDFTIICDESLQNEEYFLPPMLIQPYVENCIIHGVSHLACNGFIKVEFLKEKESLQCKIYDNGVGRSEAKKHAILKKGEKKSYSSFINQRRIDILNELDGKGYGVTIEDLDKETKTGVIVTITTPLIESDL
ncbi:MAG: PAS domain S-box protein [Crocinitomicaceae bacterium]